MKKNRSYSRRNWSGKSRDSIRKRLGVSKWPKSNGFRGFWKRMKTNLVLQLVCNARRRPSGNREVYLTCRLNVSINCRYVNRLFSIINLFYNATMRPHYKAQPFINNITQINTLKVLIGIIINVLLIDFVRHEPLPSIRRIDVLVLLEPVSKDHLKSCFRAASTRSHLSRVRFTVGNVHRSLLSHSNLTSRIKHPQRSGFSHSSRHDKVLERIKMRDYQVLFDKHQILGVGRFQLAEFFS